jgi:hypothetical protein
MKMASANSAANPRPWWSVRLMIKKELEEIGFLATPRNIFKNSRKT